MNVMIEAIEVSESIQKVAILQRGKPEFCKHVPIKVKTEK